jgi:hypothetical protein
LAGSAWLLAIRALLGSEVSPETAAAAVQAWLRLHPSPLSERLGTLQKVEVFRNDRGDALYYVVGLSPSGFVIMPADDLVEPVIAFATRGRFDPSPRHPLGALVSQDVPARVKAARAASFVSVFPDARGKWQFLRRISADGAGPSRLKALQAVRPSDPRVAPLVRTLWDQQTADTGVACYNYYTPPYPAGSPDNYCCGCVATAMAQVLNYFQWPKVGVGTNAFTIGIKGVDHTARLRGGDGLGGPYQWQSMPADPTSPTADQCQAIGALTSDAGVAARMRYAPDGSGAFWSDARNALANTFKFKRAVMATSSGPAVGLGSGLLTMINPNLDSGFPVLLAIYGPTGSHAVLCDGYGYELGTLYHHLNLGWGGHGNAWYALPTVDGVNYQFTNIDGCIYNLFPAASGEIISGRVLDTNNAPIADATVSAVRVAGGVYSATTDHRGIYALPGIPSGSKYALTASRQGHLPGTRTYSTGSSSDNPLKSGNVWRADFTLVPTNASPLITSQPVNASAMLGGMAVFHAGVIGASPLTFQWLKREAGAADGGLIAGATTASLALSNVTAADAAGYSLLLTNAYGAATSTWAALTVCAANSAFQTTFDELPNAMNEPSIPAGYGGLNWYNFRYLDAVRTTARPSGYQVGMRSASVVAFNGYGSPASITSTGLFNFVSAFLTAAWNENLRLTVEGYTAGRLTYSNSYTLSPTAPTLIRFNYLGVDEVDFISSGGTLHQGYSHPEPAEQFVLEDVTMALAGEPIIPPTFQTVSRNAGTITLRWDAVVGQRYQVQFKPDLAHADWIALSTALLATNSSAVWSDKLSTDRQRYYRVVLLP